MWLRSGSNQEEPMPVFAALTACFPCVLQKVTAVNFLTPFEHMRTYDEQMRTLTSSFSHFQVSQFWELLQWVLGWRSSFLESPASLSTGELDHLLQIIPTLTETADLDK